MKAKIHIKKIVVLFTILLINPYGAHSQSLVFNSNARKMIGLFDKYHIQPFIPNDTLSSEITELLIRELDAAGYLFIQSDVNSFLQQKEKLFSDIFSDKEDYFKNVLNVYKNSINRLDSIVRNIKETGIDFSKTDTIFFLPIGSNMVYSENISIHSKRIARILKYKSFQSAYNTGGIVVTSENEFQTKAKQSFKNVLQKFQKEINELRENSDEFVNNTLLNCIALRYDPHSNYFPKEQFQQFNKQLSAEIDSYGFSVIEDKNGSILIDGIIPGGSAWQSNQINNKDIFISVKIGTSDYSSEAYSADEIQGILDQANEKSIILTFKKQSGQIQSINLIRQKTNSNENTVNGYLLSKNKDKVGYIALPSFYADMTNNEMPGCANDVAKEIIKLEKDTIKGLIIDLRNNGGGSMLEAMNLASLFIDEGPLFILKTKNKKPQLIKDINRGSVFKKPIIVLINESSASASELFCNIVKDYNIGLVVGQTSYGKGTAQIVIPLDTTMLQNSNNVATDFVKITEGRFYRLDNSSHQSRGVIPDILLPESPIISHFRESCQLYYLKPDSVIKKVTYTAKPKKDLAGIRELSIKRIEQSMAFCKYKQLNDSINNYLFSKSQIILNYKNFIAAKTRENKLLNSIDYSENSSSIGLTCFNNTFDKKLYIFDEQLKEFNKNVMERIENDIFITETYFILIDYLKLN